jgi:hypothetical protein
VQAILNSGTELIKSNLKAYAVPYGLVNMLTSFYHAVITDWIPAALFGKKEKTVAGEEIYNVDIIHNIVLLPCVTFCSFIRLASLTSFLLHFIQCITFISLKDRESLLCQLEPVSATLPTTRYLFI